MTENIEQFETIVFLDFAICCMCHLEISISFVQMIFKSHTGLYTRQVREPDMNIASK